MTDREELILKVGVSMISGMTPEIVHAMSRAGMGLREFFDLDMPELLKELGVSGRLNLENVVRQEALFRARSEVEFMERHRIRGIFLTDDDYPPLLMELTDAPLMLYVLGKADLNPEHVMSIVGTRKPTQYGADFVASFTEDLRAYFPELLIVSGLAYGIDAMAHNGALDNGLPTVAVVAHGLDMIYPAPHRNLAKRILAAGGSIVSEYPTGTRPFQRNFLERNRIVAGMSELTVVVESEIKGGAMSTANRAFHNNREVMALPGRVTDRMSAGCNQLIRTERAHIVTCAADVVEMLGWCPANLKRAPKQRNLFPELEGNQSLIYQLLLRESAPLSIDMLHQYSQINMKDLMSTLTEMEFDGIINKLPGARYALS